MEIQLARVEGRIATREDALKLAAEWIEVNWYLATIATTILVGAGSQTICNSHPKYL